MKIIVFSLFAAVLATGCTPMGQDVGVYNHSHDYLKTDRYVAKDINIPGDLSKKNMEEFYHVPTIANQGDPSVPALLPPQDLNASETKSKGTTI